MKLLISLDSIVDTRLPILNRLDNRFMNDPESLSRYLGRKSDNFKYIGYGLFMSLYRNRDRNTLLAGLPTPMVSFLLPIITDLKAEIVRAESNETIHIDINIFPYVLLDEEIGDIIAGIQKKMPNHVFISHVNVKPDYRTYSRYRLIIDYEGLYHVEEMFRRGDLVNSTLPGTTLIAPAIVMNEEALKNVPEDEFFDGLTESYAVYIDLQLIEPSVFSYFTPELEKRGDVDEEE